MEDEISFSTKYSLITSINHSGTLDQGHYWAVLKDLNSGDWLSYNASCTNSTTTFPKWLNVTYPFLQEKLSVVKLVQGGFVFLNIFFGCEDPTCYPNPGKGLSLLPRSSEIYIPARP